MRSLELTVTDGSVDCMYNVSSIPDFKPKFLSKMVPLLSGFYGTFLLKIS